MTQEIDYFFAALDSNLRSGLLPEEALKKTVEDYAFVFSVTDERAPIAKASELALRDIHEKAKRHYQEPSEFERFFAPIIPGIPTIKDWRPDPDDPCSIIGTWAEDGSEYRMSCPPQLRDCLMALQNLLPQIIDLMRPA